MIQSEKEKLLNRESEYLSIGITEGGVAYSITGVPWERTSHAFNMKIPDVYISPEDLHDEEMLKTLRGYKLIGCYIYAPLDNYDFLSTFKDIRDLHIENAGKLRSLDFLYEMRDCDMFFLHGATLDNLDVITEVKKARRGIFGDFRCLGLDECDIGDIESLAEVSFSELIVWGKDKSEAERYKKIPASTFRYYET